MDSNNKVFYSLAPTSNAKHIDKYKDIIDYAFFYRENGEVVHKNIAFVGSYGSGKSSIIKTFFACHPELKYVFVSLGYYVEKNKKSIKMDNIETSILQQILYSVKPNKLPFSRISRIDKNYKNHYIKNLIYSFLFTILILFFYFFNNYKKYSKIIVNFEQLIIISIVSSISFFIIEFIVEFISNMKVNKVSINNVELSSEEAKISILNRNIDELIHFFEMSDVKYVVFEDIDRLNNSQVVFSKLKEINHIINLSLKNHDVRFIYSIGDDVFFVSEQRTKFFDIIVSIIPYAGTGNFIDIINKKLNDNNINNDSYALTVYPYLHNTREINDIINEYNVYSSNLANLNEMDREQLLYLMTYKVLYPERYKWLVDGHGKLFYYFSDDFLKDIRSFSLNDISNMRKELDNENKNRKVYYKATRESLNNTLKQSLVEKGINTEDYNIIIKNSNGNVICNLEEFFSSPSNYIDKLKNDIVSFTFSNINLGDNTVFDFMYNNVEAISKNSLAISKFIDSISFIYATY